MWGDGEQTRSFLYIDECVEGYRTVAALKFRRAREYRFGRKWFRSTSCVDLVADISGKKIGKTHVPGPEGVRGRNSDNRLIREKLGWEPSRSLRAGLEPTYQWISTQVMRNTLKAGKDVKSIGDGLGAQHKSHTAPAETTTV